MAINNEILPLLAHVASPRRLHYLDNLRATLTVLIIFHHAAVECGVGYLPVAIWIDVNKHSLSALFFFVSGYSASLSLTSGSSYRRFFVSRTINVGLPALLYAVAVQRFVVWLIDLVWTPGWPYVRFSGPVAYVTMLLTMEYMHLFIQWINREFPNMISARLKSLLCPGSPEQCKSNFGHMFFLLLLFILYRCLGYQTASSPIYMIPSNDIPAFDAPLSYVFAYIVGANFDVIGDYITVDLRTAYTSLIASLAVSYGSLAIACQLSKSLTIFVHTRDQYLFTNAGFNAHTIFYVLWSTFILFSIPISILSVFRRASWATREWGYLARHTYAQMYINMVPVLLAVHYTGWVADVTSRIFLVGIIGVVVSWGGMLACTAQTVIVFLNQNSLR